MPESWTSWLKSAWSVAFGGNRPESKRRLEMEPRGSINTPIMEFGSQNHDGRDGLSGPNSIMVVYVYIYIYMDPLGWGSKNLLF